MNKMRPIHPGEVLREEFLAPLGLSAHALAQALRIPAPRVNDIVRERRSVTPDTALRLARSSGQWWPARFTIMLLIDSNIRLFDRHCGGRMRGRAKTCENTDHETLRSTRHP